jgi:hypothetical protein
MPCLVGVIVFAAAIAIAIATDYCCFVKSMQVTIWWSAPASK